VIEGGKRAMASVLFCLGVLKPVCEHIEVPAKVTGWNPGAEPLSTNAESLPRPWPLDFDSPGIFPDALLCFQKRSASPPTHPPSSKRGFGN
jgi:hypothetical protein